MTLTAAELDRQRLALVRALLAQTAARLEAALDRLDPRPPTKENPR